MIKFEKVTPGSVLLDVHRHRMGNTTMREWGCWRVEVIEIDLQGQRARVSWNGNRSEWYPRRRIERLYLNPPKAYREQCERRGREPERGHLAPAGGDA